MSKKSIKHSESNKSAKNMANAKQHELINVKWESTPSWTSYVFSSDKKTDNKKEYKLFPEEGNKGNDDYDKES